MTREIDLVRELTHADPTGDALVLWDRDVAPELIADNFVTRVYYDGAGVLTVSWYAPSSTDNYAEFRCDPVPHWATVAQLRRSSNMKFTYDRHEPPRDRGLSETISTGYWIYI